MPPLKHRLFQTQRIVTATPLRSAASSCFSHRQTNPLVGWRVRHQTKAFGLEARSCHTPPILFKERADCDHEDKQDYHSLDKD
jgi:hypothetical protein